MSTVESSRILLTSPSAARVGALLLDPCAGIVIPFVALVGDCPKSCFDVVPALLVLDPATDQHRDEGAASPASHASIELGNELVVNRNVQSHVSTIAHWSWGDLQIFTWPRP